METIEVLDRAEISGSNVIVEYSKTEAALADLRAKYAGVVFDLKTTKGDKEARAARLELVTLRTSLEKKREEFKAPALAFGNKIDAEAKRVKAEIVKLETFIDQQIKADEDRRAAEKAEKDRIEALRVQGLKDKIAVIRGFVAKCQGISAERIAKGIELVSKIDTGADVFFEFQGQALAAQVETLQAMRGMHTAAESRESEAARVEAQRIENERIAEQNRIQAEAMAMQQAALDKAAADIKSEQDRLEAERERLAEQERVKEQARVDAEIAASAKAQQEAKAEEDSLIDGIWKQARRIEGGSVGYIQKAIGYFESGPADFANDPRQRVSDAVAAARAEMNARLLTAKAQSEAQAKADAEAKRASDEAIAKAKSEVSLSAPIDKEEPSVSIAIIAPVAMNNVSSLAGKDNESGPPTLKLGQICTRLGFQVTAEFLRSLGFEPTGRERAAVLFHSEIFTEICKALAIHIESVAKAYEEERV